MSRLLLDERESALIETLVSDLIRAGEPWDPVRFADRAVLLAQKLPVRLRQFLAEVRATEEEVAVVSGLPVDRELVPTPIGWELAAKSGAAQREELLLLLCASALGEPFAWSDQQDGRLVHDVCPAPGMEQSATSASSTGALSLHTEDAHHTCRGDYVALLCLRNPDAVATTFARARSLSIPDKERAVLSAHRYRFDPDHSHVQIGFSAVPAESGAILFGPEDRPYLRIDLDMIAPADVADEEAETAVHKLTELLHGRREEIVLAAGDLLFVDNYRVVHGRDSYLPRYDGGDRWLKRTNLSRDLRRAFIRTGARSRIVT